MYRSPDTTERERERAQVKRMREREREWEWERVRAFPSRAALNVKCANYGARAAAIECDCDCGRDFDCDWQSSTHTNSTHIHTPTEWACLRCNLAAFCLWRQTNALIFIASPTVRHSSRHATPYSLRPSTPLTPPPSPFLLPYIIYSYCLLLLFSFICSPESVVVLSALPLSLLFTWALGVPDLSVAK